MKTVEGLKLECLTYVNEWIAKGEPTLIEDLINNALNKFVPSGVFELLFVICEAQLEGKAYFVNTELDPEDRNKVSAEGVLYWMVDQELRSYLYDLLAVQINAQYPEKEG